jgi:hypothetical protein
MADAPKSLGQVRNVLRSEGVFILEYASKLNLKAILRYLSGRQKWSPFNQEPVEFATLNYDFHPKAIRGWLKELGFTIEKTLTLSHFRVGFLKRVVPTNILVSLDSLFQWTGDLWQLTPSVFVRAIKSIKNPHGVETRPAFANPTQVFKCPDCGYYGLSDEKTHLECLKCGKKWEFRDGIYDFRKSLGG